MTTSAVAVGEHAASWWIPEHPDCTVAGKYIVNENGTTIIEIFEDLQEKVAATTPGFGDTWPLLGPDIYPMLHGQADGRFISAFAARLIGMSTLTGLTRVERRQPRYTVESELDVLNVLGLKTRKARFEPKCLSRLMGWHSEPDDARERQVDGSTLHTLMRATKPDQIAILDGVKLTLEQKYLREIDNRDDSVSVSKSGVVTIELEHSISPSEMSRRYVRPMMSMFSLMSARPEGLASFEFLNDDGSPVIADASGMSRQSEAWMTLRAHVARSSEADSVKGSPLLITEFIDWPEAVKCWLNWSRVATAEMQLMTLLLDPSYPWLETNFVACAQMVEGVHRKSFPVADEAIKDHKDLMENVVARLAEIEGMNGKKRGKVNSALKYLYEPSLERRIQELDSVAGRVVSGPKDVDMRKVAHGCGSLRNAFAHSTGNRPTANADSALVALAVLSLIGFSFLLTKLGKSGAEAAAIMGNWEQGRDWNYVVSNNWRILDMGDEC